MKFEVKKIDTPYRIAIKVTYNHEINIINKNTNTPTEETILTLGPMSFGDPCVVFDNNRLIERNCSENGYCTRLEKPMDYNCNCNQNFNISKDCDIEDFCESDNTFEVNNEVILSLKK
jgi:hypothetical protein